MMSADIIVIGLGAIGSAALHQAASRGARVVGIDRFYPPHDLGSSHGDTRITRQAIGEGREFVPLVLRSDEIWEQLQAATGLSLVTRNGGLVMASPSVKGSHHGSHSFVQDTIDAAVEFGVTHQVFTASELQQRFPQFRLNDDEVGYYEPGAGFLRPESCVSAHLSEAVRLGAQIFPSETVLELKSVGCFVEVRTTRSTYCAAKAIVTVGPWIQQLLSKEYQHLFRVYRQVMNWFAIADHPDRYSPERFPIFIWLTGSEPRDMLYGFPAIDGPNGGVKISTEQYETMVDPDTVSRSVTPAEVQAVYTESIHPRFPGISPLCLRSQTCLYSVTPDSKFIVDRFRGEETILFASACSGHGFKHSAAVGEALAMSSLDQAPLIDLSPFRLKRFYGAPEA